MQKSSFDHIARMKIKKESIEKFFDTGLLVDSRTIYFGENTYDSEGRGQGIDSSVTEYVVKGLHVLNNISSKPIRVIMNSPGENIDDGFAIYDGIRSSNAPVDIEVIGSAMSMASIILQAGRYRLIHPNTTFMIHEGYMETGKMTPRAQQSWAKWSEEDNKRMYRIFGERTKKGFDFWEKQSLKKSDYIFDANIALKIGFADRILPPANWTKKL